MMPEVTERNLEMGIKWAEYMRLHAAVMYDGLSDDAWRLLKLVATGDVYDGVSVRDVYRAGRPGLRSKADVVDALAMIPDLMQSSRVKGSGRPSEIIRLHPQLQDMLNNEK